MAKTAKKATTKWCTVTEASRIIGLGKEAIRQHCKKGSLPCIYSGDPDLKGRQRNMRILIPLDALMDFAKNGERRESK